MSTATELWRFVGRSDVFAYQTKGGAYYPERRALTTEDLEEHIAGFSSIGTYSLTPNDGTFTVQNIVFDLDTYDEQQLATLTKAVEFLVDPYLMSYPMLMLESSGGKGYHVWLFLDQPVEAWRALAWLDAEFWPQYIKAGGDPKLEVFPKQSRLSEGGLGNLTKLPFGTHAVTGNKSEIVLTHGWVSEAVSIRAMDTASIDSYSDRKPQTFGVVTAETPTGILLTNGPVARFIKGEVEQGERNSAFHAFFTWTAWNVHLPAELAWEWWADLNEQLADPETDTESTRKTLESAYARPPADAGSSRPSRGSSDDARSYRSTPLAERVPNTR